MSLARTERAALAALFVELGPDQPTLDHGWQTKDLLNHLLVRERRPDAGLANVIPPLQRWTVAVTRSFDEQPWSDRVAAFRAGPPAWNPMGWGKIDEVANGAEMFIHHEDARRGQPGWTPRDLGPERTAELRGVLGSFFSKVALRKMSGGVVADLGDGRPLVLKKGEPSAVIAGAPGEVLLWLSGRDAAQVRFTGDDRAVDELKQLTRGM